MIIIKILVILILLNSCRESEDPENSNRVDSTQYRSMICKITDTSIVTRVECENKSIICFMGVSFNPTFSNEPFSCKIKEVK